MEKKKRNSSNNNNSDDDDTLNKNVNTNPVSLSFNGTAAPPMPPQHT